MVGGPGDIREDDDHLHNPTPRDLEGGKDGRIFTRRGKYCVASRVVVFYLTKGLHQVWPI